MNAIQGYVGTLGYFKGISADELAYIGEMSVLRTFGANEMIFMEGDAADGIWIVESGHVKIYKLNPDGGEHILHLRGPGNSFNDIAALDGGPNPANASSLGGETQVWLIPHAVIHYVLSRNNQVALNVIGMLARRVRTLVGQIEDLALYGVIVRLARFLLKQAGDPSLTGPGVTRQAIAAHISTTPQTISTVLRSLEESGAIRFDRQRIVILDEKILRTIAMQ
jgi:CRP/FNR family transcriptional regulator